MAKKDYQVVVVGGGINGAGVAREAIANGYKTLLIEKDDYAHATSSQSSKLLHGGVRYLEQGHFGLVFESLRERKILLDTAQHITNPIRLRIPIYKGDKRPLWKVRLGIKIYDWFAGNRGLKPSCKLSKQEVNAISALKTEGLAGVVEYSDAQVIDSRLTLETILSAKSFGLDAYNYTEMLSANSQDDGIEIQCLNKRTNEQYVVKTNFLVNASGPWCPSIDRGVIQHEQPRPALKYVRGIHFVINAIPEQYGYCLLPKDGRIVFVLPWMEKYTLIGTTESDYEGSDFDHIEASDTEIEYLLNIFNHYFPQHRIDLDDILHTYAGVRSLVYSHEDNLSEISREYRICKDMLGHDQGYIAIFGGKLTTYRSLAQKVLETINANLEPALTTRFRTEQTGLIGSIPTSAQAAQSMQNRLQALDIADAVIQRWRRLYGARWLKVGEYAAESEYYREPLVACEYFLRAELQYLVDDEEAHQLDDVILRRTKLAYELSASQKQALQAELDRLNGSAAKPDAAVKG